MNAVTELYERAHAAQMHTTEYIHAYPGEALVLIQRLELNWRREEKNANRLSREIENLEAQRDYLARQWARQRIRDGQEPGNTLDEVTAGVKGWAEYDAERRGES